VNLLAPDVAATQQALTDFNSGLRAIDDYTNSLLEENSIQPLTSPKLEAVWAKFDITIANYRTVEETVATVKQHAAQWKPLRATLEDAVFYRISEFSNKFHNKAVAIESLLEKRGDQTEQISSELRELLSALTAIADGLKDEKKKLDDFSSQVYADHKILKDDDNLIARFIADVKDWQRKILALGNHNTAELNILWGKVSPGRDNPFLNEMTLDRFTGQVTHALSGISSTLEGITEKNELAKTYLGSMEGIIKTVMVKHESVINDLKPKKHPLSADDLQIADRAWSQLEQYIKTMLGGPAHALIQ
jgi:hypothetical protein